MVRKPERTDALEISMHNRVICYDMLGSHQFCLYYLLPAWHGMSSCPILNCSELSWKLLQDWLHINLELGMAIVICVCFEPK